MSRSIRPSEICKGPRCELAVKRQMRRKELKMLAMANNASATKVGCHISQLLLGFCPLYCKKIDEETIKIYELMLQIKLSSGQT